MGVHLLALEVVHGGFGGPFGRDSEDTLAQIEGHRVPACDVSEEGMQSCEACVASGNGVLSVVLQVLEESENGIDTEIGEGELLDLSAVPRHGEAQQELERVTVRQNCVRTDVSLGGQVLVEKRAQVLAEIVIRARHREPPAWP